MENSSRPFPVREDSDMKIAGERVAADLSEKQSPDISPDPVTEQDLQELSRNGDFRKAKQLGNVLASFCLEPALPDEVFHRIVSPNAALQTRIFAVFLAECSAKQAIANSLVSQTVVNELHRVLASGARVFYEQLKSTGAYTVYLLAIRDGDPATNIVTAFASLCEIGKDEAEKVRTDLKARIMPLIGSADLAD